jgi:hypothetical protein
VRRIVAVLAGLLVIVALWEGYKAVGNPDGTVLFGVRVLPRADDLSMPHVWTVLQRLGRPELTGGRPVWIVVLQACLFTLGITAVGFLVGAAVGQLHAWGSVGEPVWLVPAPTRPSAARRRGGDPVHVMATAAARTAARAGLPTGVAPCLVTAGRARDSVGLDAAQRQRNLAGRVRLLAGVAPPPGVDVVLVDDVLSTGATAVAATGVLRAAGLGVAGMLVLAAVPDWVAAR